MPNVSDLTVGHHDAHRWEWACTNQWWRVPNNNENGQTFNSFSMFHLFSWVNFHRQLLYVFLSLRLSSWFSGSRPIPPWRIRTVSWMMVANGSKANSWPNKLWRAGPQVGPYFSASSYWKPPHREPFIVTHSWLPRLMTTTVSLGYCSIIVKKSTKISVDQSQRSACHSERSWALVLESATTPLKRHQWNNPANHVFSCFLSGLVPCFALGYRRSYAVPT